MYVQPYRTSLCTTESYLAALALFLSSTGNITSMYCDCTGTYGVIIPTGLFGTNKCNYALALILIHRRSFF